MVILRIELENDVIQCDTRAINNFYDLKKSIYEADNIIIKHFTCDNGEKIHLYNLLEDYQDKKITAIRDYTEYEFTGKEQEKMRCIKCRGFFSDITITFKHSSKCRKEISNPNKNKHQINSFSLSRIEVDDNPSPFTSVEITLDKKSDENESDFFHLDHENKTSNSSNILQHSPYETKSEIKECAVANALKDVFNIKKETKNEKNYSKSLLESSNFSWPSNLKNDDNILKNSLDSTQADSIQVISLNEPQKDPILNGQTRLKLGELKFRKIKQKRIIKFLKPMFSKLSYGQMMKLSDSHNYIGIIRGRVILAGAVIKTYTASEDIPYCDLVFIGVRPRRRGYGKMMINMLKKTYKKIIVCADNSILDFYKKLKFTQAKSLIYPLASQVRSFNKSLFMKFGFLEEEISKIKIWGTAVSNKIIEDQAKKRNKVFE